VCEYPSRRSRFRDDVRQLRHTDVIDWAGEDFDRRAAVAKARDYRPEWIANHIIDRPLSTREAKILGRM
jgi:hypothetical protein